MFNNSLSLQLHRDLVRSIKQGHPWVYQQALKDCPRAKKGTPARLSCRRGKFLAWGYYDPDNPIAYRVISLNRDAPTLNTLRERLRSAIESRRSWFSGETTGFRLLNGEGDFFPGLICDIYTKTAVLQCDGAAPFQFWPLEWLSKELCSLIGTDSVYLKSSARVPSASHWLAGEGSLQVSFLENGIEFQADLEKGQKTGFFFDQRNNRQFVRQMASKRQVLNLFSYNGGFSLYAGKGGAKSVTSVDISKGALAAANEIWSLNQLDPNCHKVYAEDVTNFLEKTDQTWDLIIVDPPSFAPSEASKPKALAKYTSLFSLAAQKMDAGGLLCLASCSSHIGFTEFYQLAIESISKARRRARVLNISGQPEDHPFPIACEELRYLKFMCLKMD